MSFGNLLASAMERGFNTWTCPPEKIRGKFSPLFVTGSRNRKFLKKHGLSRVEELDWWQSTSLPNEKKLFFVPAQHFSGRYPWNINKSLWGVFVIESSFGNIYFADDTGFGKFFEQIHERFPDIRLALLPIGAYEPRWFMGPMHLNPDDAVGINAPSQQLKIALNKHGVDPEEFIILKIGETAIV